MSVDARAAYFMANRSRYQTGYSRVFVISTSYAATPEAWLNIGAAPQIGVPMLTWRMVGNPYLTGLRKGCSSSANNRGPVSWTLKLSEV